MPTNYNDKPDIEELMHYGVQGMKWGRRKARPTANQIHDARKKIDRYEKSYGQLEDKRSIEGNKASDKKIDAQLKKMEADFKRDPARAVALHQTRGEQMATVFLGGPLGLVAVGANAVVARQVGKNIEKNRKAKATPKTSQLNPGVSRGK